MGDQQRRPVRQGPEPAPPDRDVSAASQLPLSHDPASDPLSMQDTQGNQAALDATDAQTRAEPPPAPDATPPAGPPAPTSDSAGPGAPTDPAQQTTTPPAATPPADPEQEKKKQLDLFAQGWSAVYEGYFGKEFVAGIRRVDTEFGRFEIHPAGKLPTGPVGAPNTIWMWYALPPIRLDHQRVTEEQFAEKEKFHAKVVAARREVLEQAEKGFGSPDQERAFWQGKDPAVLEALYRDREFLEAPLWDARPEALVAVSEHLDPVKHLAKALLGVFGEKGLDVVQAWSRAHGEEDRARAAADPDVATRLKRFEDAQLAIALDYLRCGGSLGSSAQDRIARAIAAKDVEAFLTAWRAAIEDPKLLDTYQDDANFLTLVLDNLGDAAHEHVLTSLQYGAEASKNDDLRLTPDERERFGAFADDCCRAMKPELEATAWCEDKPVLDALVAYFANVSQVLRDLSKGSAEAAQAARAKRELARDLLKERWQGYDSAGMSLRYRICDGMTDPELTQALDLIDEDDGVRRAIVVAQEAAERVKATEAGARAGSGAAPPLALTENEHDRLKPHLAACLEVLHQELVEDANSLTSVCDDEVVLGAIKEYRYAITQIVKPQDDTDPRHVFACDKRRAEALQLVEATWPEKDPDGKSLEWRMNDGLQGDDEKEGSRLLSEADATHRREAEEWYQYTADFSDAERQRVGNLAREWATRLADTMEGLVSVDDALVADQLRKAREAMESAVMPRSGSYADGKFDRTKIDPAIRATMDEKVDRAMVAVKDKYDAVYGSLVTDVFDHVQDDAARRECLRLVGHTRDETRGLRGEALAGVVGTDDDKLAYQARLETFSEKITALAERLADELDDTFVDGADVVAMTERFEELRVDFKSLETGSAAFGPTGFLRFLEIAFRPLGGSLRHAIADRVRPEPTADEALANLGIAGGAKAVTVKVDQRLPEADQNAIRELQVPVRSVFAVAENDQVAVDVLVRHLRVAKEKAAGAADPKGALLATYRQANGIDLPLHLGMARPSERDLARCAEALGWPADALKPVNRAERDQAVDDRAADPDRLAKDAPELAFDPLKVKPGFTLAVAVARARELDRVARRGDEDAMTTLLSGPPEEVRVVNAAFVRLFGYDVRFRLRQGFAAAGEAKVARYERLAQTGGAESNLVDELRQYVSAGAIEQIYKEALLAKPAEKQAILGAGDLLYAMKKAFDDEQYDRIYRSLTGELTVGDMLRTRDTGSWATLWLGTDEKGAEDDVRLFFEALKATLDREEGLASARDEAGRKAILEKIGATVREKARALLRDADVVAMLEKEFGAEELLKMKQLLIGAGKQSPRDKVWADLVGLGTGDALMENLKALPDADRARLRADANFMTALYRDLSGDDVAEALAILSAAKGKESAAALGKATSGLNTDEHAVFETVLGMSPDELAAFARDRIAVARVRKELDDDDEERKLFDELLAGARALPADAATSAAVEPRREAARARQREYLVLVHTVALKHGCHEGADYALEAAQKTYGEKGALDDPTAKEPAPGEAAPPPERLFGNPERERVWAAVKGLVEEKTSPEFQRVIKDAVLGFTDPSSFRLRKGFAGVDSERAIKSSIENAPVETVVGEWSNVCRPGLDGTSLADRWTERVRTANIVRDLEERGAKPEEIQLAKRQALLAEHAFAWFALDVSQHAEAILAQRGPTVGEDLLLSTGDADLLGYVGLVRKRVLALTEADVQEGLRRHLTGEQARWTALGASTIGAEAGSAAKALDDAEEPVFVTEGRKALSRASHARADYDQQRGQYSLANEFSDSDEILDLEYQRLMGQLGKAMEGDSAKGEAGGVSAEEGADLDRRLAAFNVAKDEYKATKAAVASAMKWAAIVIITAVATVLTGPGGPTLLAAMLTAAATSTASAVIDEVVMGKDYEFVQKGMRDVVKDTAIAALTFGVGKGWEKFAAQSGKLGPLADKAARFAAWEKALAEGADKSVGGFAAFVLESGAKAALLEGTGKLSDAALTSLDLAEWKYGWEQGASHTGKTFEEALAKLPEDMLDTLWQTILVSSGKAFKGRLPLIGKGEKKDGALLPGVALPEAPDDDPGALAEMGRAFFGKAFGPKAVVGDLYDTAVKKLAATLDAVKDDGAGAFRGSKLSEKDVGAFLVAWARSRFEKGVNAAAEKGQETRNAQLAEEALETLKGEIEAALAAVPEGERGAASAHFREFLKSGVQDHDRAVAEWKSKWADVQARLERQTATLARDPAAQAQADAYRRWVLSDPEKVDERAAFPASRYAEVRGQAEALIARKSAMDEVNPALDPEQQMFWEAMTRDPDNLVVVRGGGLGSRQDLDVGHDDTDAGLERFVESVRRTKAALVASYARPTAEVWAASGDPGRAKAAGLAVAANDPARQPRLTTLDPEGARKAVAEWAESWGRDYDRTHAEAAQADETRRAVEQAKADADAGRMSTAGW